MIQQLLVLKDRASTKAGGRSIQVTDVREAIMCANTIDADVAAVFCRFVHNTARNGGIFGCDVLHEAGAVPVVFDLLRYWSSERKVVFQSCAALWNLAWFASPTVKAAMLAVSDCEALLLSAQASELDGGNNAALAMSKLGIAPSEKE